MKEGRGFAFLLKNEKDCSLERMVFAAYPFCMVTLYVLCANYL